MLSGQRQHGLRSLPDTSTHDQKWELKPRPFDLESNWIVQTQCTLPACSRQQDLQVSVTVLQVNCSFNAVYSVAVRVISSLLNAGLKLP